MANVSELADLASVLGTLKGGDTETKTKRTSKTDVSDAGVTELLDQILSAPGGVKDIGASARRAGVYDDTTSDLLLGDLYATAANKAELARSPTSENMSQTVAGPEAGIGELAATLALTSGAKAAYKGIAGMLAPEVAAPVAEVAGGLVAGGSQVGSSAVTLGTVPPAAQLVGTDIAAGGLSAAGGAGGVSAGAGAVSGGGSSFLSNTNLVGGAGGILSGLLQGRDAANDPASLATTAAVGAMYGGPVGALVAAGGQIVGGLLSGSGSFSPVKGIKTGIKSIGKIFGF